MKAKPSRGLGVLDTGQRGKRGAGRLVLDFGMNSEITSSAMQKLLGVNKVALNDLAKRGIVKRGERKGTFAVEASVGGYCQHLREMASDRGGEAGADVRARLGAAQANLAEKVKMMRGETPPTAEGSLTQELRAALDEFADDKAA
jgi:phage terminase Nu1 subunit (DNA packaging protein)